MERRNHPRKQVIRYALLYHPHGFVCPCRVDNVSSSGPFIKTTDLRITKGNCVDVTIDASCNGQRPISAKGLVVHKEDSGIGLLCENDFPIHDLITGPR